MIKNAFIQSRHRPGGVNLGLQRLNLQIWWQGRSGMVVNRLRDQIHTMLGFEDPPKFLILHVGGSDLGYKKVGHLRNEIKLVLRCISRKMPQTKIVWSQILPRFSWRY